VSLLVIMGSGETAPTMVGVHRRVFAEVGPGPSLLLDSPYGFQGNADDLNARAVAYFADVADRTVEPLGWRRPGDTAAADRVAAALRRARWAFAGPGSPTYALRVWEGSGLAAEVAELVARGGAAVFASAAALTLGSHTVPVYEIYKVGEDPRWREGLHALARVAGIEAAVVPHWDNSEGGNHDTRFCYLGQARLEQLEATLPDGVGVLGVDEHTALVIDPVAGTADVDGRGTVTARYRGSETVWRSGTTVPLEELAARLRGDAAGPEQPAGPVRTAGTSALESTARAAAGAGGTGEPASLRAAADAAESAFDAAVNVRDAHRATRAVLDLEQALTDWSSDTTQSDDHDHARRTLRALVVRLGELAVEGVVDPAERLAPFVTLLLARREAARDARDWPAADAVRDGLVALGVELRDSPEGTTWRLRTGGTP
jgi:cyanophycinase-like exopeptidase